MYALRLEDRILDCFNEEGVTDFIKGIESIAEECDDTIGELTLCNAIKYCLEDEVAFEALASMIEVD